MGHPVRLTLAALVLAALAGCTSEPDDAENDQEHVWKEQTEAIDKAREVETILKRNQDLQQQENQ